MAVCIFLSACSLGALPMNIVSEHHIAFAAIVGWQLANQAASPSREPSLAPLFVCYCLVWFTASTLHAIRSLSLWSTSIVNVVCETPALAFVCGTSPSQLALYVSFGLGSEWMQVWEWWVARTTRRGPRSVEVEFRIMCPSGVCAI